MPLGLVNPLHISILLPTCPHNVTQLSVCRKTEVLEMCGYEIKPNDLKYRIITRVQHKSSVDILDYPGTGDIACGCLVIL